MSSNAAEKAKTYPFTIRLTAEQRALLEHKAAGRPLDEYLRSTAINDNEPDKQRRNMYPIKDQTVAHQILVELGRSRMPENLAQLAHAAKLGILELTPEESAILLSACADIL